MTQANNQSDNIYRAKVGAILFLTGIFFLNFTSRVVLAPLMPAIELDLGLSHARSRSMFLMISLGYFITMTGSGIISSRIKHHWMIALSAMLLGGALLAANHSRSFTGVSWALVFLGMGAGLYIPSAISTITALVRQENWGKALAVHELAPNLGLITAPILAEMFIIWFSWRSLLFALGVASLALGAIYARLGRGGDFRGQAPKPEIIRSLLGQRSFWIMMAFFSLGVGGSMGAYNMMTLYMVNEGGLDRGLANTILAVSRVSGLFAAFISGWIADRYGVKRALTAIFLSSGLATILLGFTGGSWLVVMVFLQAALSAAFFPVGLVALSGVGRPTERNVVVSLAIPMSFIIGGGIFPTGIGYLGEVYSFSSGFILTGTIILLGAVLVGFLDLREHQPAEE